MEEQTKNRRLQTDKTRESYLHYHERIQTYKYTFYTLNYYISILQQNTRGVKKSRLCFAYYTIANMPVKSVKRMNKIFLGKTAKVKS